MRSKATIPARKLRNQKIKQMKKKENPEPREKSTGKKYREKDLIDYNSLTDGEEKEFWWDDE